MQVEVTVKFVYTKPVYEFFPEEAIFKDVENGVIALIQYFDGGSQNIPMIITNVQAYKEEADNIEARHHVRMQAADLEKEL